MTRIFAILLCASLILSLAACGSGDTQGSSAPSEAAAPTQTASQTAPPSQSNNSAPVENSEDAQDENEQEETAPTSEDTGSSAESAAAPASNNNDTQTTQTQGSRILVAYFSRYDNMVFDPSVDAVSSASVIARNGDYVGVNLIAAEMVVDLTGGDLFSIVQTDKYPAGYRTTTDLASQEKSNNARPALSTSVPNMADYDTVILIYPNWWATIPMGLFTFLEQYDFSGKTIAPICTHEGSGLGSSMNDIRSLAPGATIVDGLAIRGSNITGARSQIENWINGLDI